MRSHVVTATATAAVAAAVIALSACSSGGGATGARTPSAAGTSACETVLVQELKAAYDAGRTAAPAPTPSACVGIDAATLQKLAAEATKAVIAQELPSGLPTDASALPTLPGDNPTMAPSDMPSGMPTTMPTTVSSTMATFFPSAGTVSG